MQQTRFQGDPLSFDIDNLYREGLPAPEGEWTGIPAFSFVGGNNDEANVPVAGLSEAATRVFQREGRKLAVYNLGDRVCLSNTEVASQKLGHLIPSPTKIQNEL